MAEVSDKPITVALLEANNQRVEMMLDGERLTFQRPAPATSQSQTGPPTTPATRKDVVAAPMPGRVTGTLVTKGEKVRAGDPLVMIESMKMEIAVRSDRDAEVEETLAEEGATVKRGQALVRFRT